MESVPKISPRILPVLLSIQARKVLRGVRLSDRCHRRRRGGETLVSMPQTPQSALEVSQKQILAKEMWTGTPYLIALACVVCHAPPPNAVACSSPRALLAITAPCTAVVGRAAGERWRTFHLLCCCGCCSPCVMYDMPITKKCGTGT